MQIYRFMELDTCPMCGDEIWVRDNPYVGTRNIEDIPADTVFEIACENNERGKGCGYFSIMRRDQKSLDNDWVASYIINAPHPNDQ